MLELRRESPDSHASRELFAAYMELVRERLPGFTPTPAIFGTPAELAAPAAVWLVAYEDGVPVGCGGFTAPRPGVAHLKRMFVRPEARGRGHGRRLLAALESAAAAAGRRRVELHTTEVLREARQMYAKAGYTVVAMEENDGRRDYWLAKDLVSA